MLSSFGPMSLSLYSKMRDYSREHVLLVAVLLLIMVGVGIMAYRWFKKFDKEDKRIILFAKGFMLISLLPFLGLGNIASRYDYLFSFGFVILLALFARKAYGYLASSGRDVAMGIMAVLVGIFFLLNIIQVQQLHGDWKGAGEKVNKLFISIEGLYSNDWSKGPVDLYFVNVPVRQGDAWVFPVGLADALWFTFENPNIHVHQMQSVDAALNMVSDPKSQKVFVFDEDGKVTEKRKPLPQTLLQ